MFSQIPKVWLRDKGAYPIIGILALAITNCTGFMIYKLQSPDVFFSKNKRKQILRD